jgi:hypothetical protein
MLPQELHVAERTMHTRVDERLFQADSHSDKVPQPSEGAFERIILTPAGEASDTAMLAHVQRLALRSVVILAVWRPAGEAL